MKSFFAGLFAAVVGAITLILLFFRKGGASFPISVKGVELEKKADSLKVEIKTLDEKIGKSVDEKSLEDELEYWNKEKK
jgi:hypothetical protein